MATRFKLIILLLLFGLFGCSKEEGFTEINTNLSEFENRLVGSWQYTSIEVSSREFVYADQFNEPGDLATTIGQRAEIKRRIIHYSADRLYQLRWTDRGEYQLGTENTANWQPNFGYWSYDSENNTLIHNEGLHYKIAYSISLTGNNTMTRVSKRIMASDYDPSIGRVWNKGQELTFKEVFQRVDN